MFSPPGRDRTCDLLIKSQQLYHSATGEYQFKIYGSMQVFVWLHSFQMYQYNYSRCIHIPYKLIQDVHPNRLDAVPETDAVHTFCR